MNRREFIKKAMGLAVSIAVPVTIIPKERKLSNWPDQENYTLGKGTLYVKEKGSDDWEQIHNTITFTLDELTIENLNLAFDKEKEGTLNFK